MTDSSPGIPPYLYRGAPTEVLIANVAPGASVTVRHNASLTVVVITDFTVNLVAGGDGALELFSTTHNVLLWQEVAQSLSGTTFYYHGLILLGNGDGLRFDNLMATFSAAVAIYGFVIPQSLATL